MMYQRKDPLCVEAVEFNDEIYTPIQLLKLGMHPVTISYKNPDDPVIKVTTSFGTFCAHKGDIITKNRAGSFYVYSKTDFNSLYEDVPIEFLDVLAKDIHESFRIPVERKNTIAQERDRAFPYREWEDLSENVKQGRRMAARYLLDRYDMRKICD